MIKETPVLVKFHRDLVPSPLAIELAKVIKRFREQWLPEKKEREKLGRRSGWSFLNATAGSFFFFLLFLTRSIHNAKDIQSGRFESAVSFIGMMQTPWIAACIAVFFGILIYFQKGRGSPISIFLGGVALPALAVWITRSAMP